MKSPDEIKKGLECCQTSMTTKYKVCSKCGYFDDGYECENVLREDALAYIQQLERERDAAVKELEVYKFCTACKHDNDNLDKNNNSPCFGCSSKSNWQWRGAQEVKE